MDGNDDVHVPPRTQILCVTGQSTRQPDDIGGADGSRHLGFDVGLAELRVPEFIQLHRLRDQKPST